MNLTEPIEAGDTPGVLRKLDAMTLEEREACVPALAARLAEAEAAAAADVWWWSSRESYALASAELGCRTAPHAAAAWLVAPEQRRRSWGWMVDVVNLYPAAWRAELVAEIGRQATPGTGGWFPIAEHLICDTGCPVPVCDAFVAAWLEEHRSTRREPSGEKTPGGAQPLGGVQRGTSLERLGNDRFTPALLPLGVERAHLRTLPDVEDLAELAADGTIEGAPLIRRALAELDGGGVAADPDDDDGAPWAAGLVEAFALAHAEEAWPAGERAALRERLLARLLQERSRNETAAGLAALRALAPVPAENAVFVRDFTAMLDLSSPVAAYGQRVLAGLDEAGLLEADVRTEACERVLLRPEKKLVRAQLSWLDKAARRAPGQAGRILVEAAAAFQHPDVDVQERTLKLIGRHLRRAGGDVLPELRAAAGTSAGLAERARELLGPETGPAQGTLGTRGAESTPQSREIREGQEPPAGQYAETLPPAPEPRPVPGPIATAAEVAEEVAAVMANRGDMMAFERALDGLVRHARLDRPALAAALSVIRQSRTGPFRDFPQHHIYDAAAFARDGEWPEQIARFRTEYLRGTAFRTDSMWFPPAGTMLVARLTEAMEAIESGSQPFLLATPTLATGAIDAAVLVERIAEFEALGAVPGPDDLAQALLRVAPAPGEHVHRAAEKLESGAGQRLARWLREGGLAHQDSTPPGWPAADPASAPPGEWLPARPGRALDPPLGPAAAALIGPEPSLPWPAADVAPYWLAQLPHHRDEVTARTHAARPEGVLPYLVESGGAAGFAVHWKIAEVLDGHAAVDALLVLAAQGRLDGGLLGGLLQARVRFGSSEPNRVVATLRAAAETGAYATVWSVLAAALPGLLRDKPVRGAGAFLALAAECAARCGATGPIAAVDAVAGRKGSSQTIKNARLLRDALRREEQRP
ncbi:DUF6493 family protein [Streptomonospora sediminis]